MSDSFYSEWRYDYDYDDQLMRCASCNEVTTRSAIDRDGRCFVCVRDQDGPDPVEPPTLVEIEDAPPPLL